jgi:hypothetical protein
MKNKSTHYGTCQFCGSLQKLPDGVLAYHGYEVTWHQFVGGCQGSGRLPFEQNKDYAEQCLALSKDFLAENHAPEKPASDPYLHQRKNPDTIDYWAKVRMRQMHDSIVRWLQPRCNSWAPRPLRPVEEVEVGRENIKIKSRNIRELANIRDDAKHELIKLVELASKNASGYLLAQREPDSTKFKTDEQADLYYSLPYPATNVVEKMCKILGKTIYAHDNSAPLVDQLREAKAKFDKAKATHAEAKKAIDAERAEIRAQMERKAA